MQGLRPRATQAYLTYVEEVDGSETQQIQAFPAFWASACEKVGLAARPAEDEQVSAFQLDVVFDGQTLAAATVDTGQASLDAGTFTAGQTSKVAAAFKANDFAACIDGGTVATDTSGTIPTVDRAFIGINALGTGDYLNGHIKTIRFYPSRLTDSELVALTT